MRIKEIDLLATVAVTCAQNRDLVSFLETMRSLGDLSSGRPSSRTACVGLFGRAVQRKVLEQAVSATEIATEEKDGQIKWTL